MTLDVCLRVDRQCVNRVQRLIPFLIKKRHELCHMYHPINSTDHSLTHIPSSRCLCCWTCSLASCQVPSHYCRRQHVFCMSHIIFPSPCGWQKCLRGFQVAVDASEYTQLNQASQIKLPHRIIKPFGLQGTFKHHIVLLPCHDQGHFSLNQFA